ncbi:MAG: RHS repeat-associated core domain-containing protein [Saprospiraceae bacterium]|nr:RHS repeat-associated core domain-containing protein [Saprospiraceae bacterium]
MNFRANGAAVTFLEEMHYYPFGMLLEGIGSIAASNPNKYRFNGVEQNEDLGLNLNLSLFRGYDVAIGRWIQTDPLADMSPNFSSYIFSNNNPAFFNDPLGLQGDTSIVLPVVTVVAKAIDKVNKTRNQIFDWFNGVNVGYRGSGWGHGPRRWLSKQLGLGNTANNVFELVLHSQLQSSQVNFSGQLLDKVKSDPAMIEFQNNIIKILKLDPRFKNISFITKGRDQVRFGGERWSSQNENWGALNQNNPLMHGETWAVACRELTWATRHATIDYTATAKTDGTIVVYFHLSDVLDLSAQKGRSEAYNNISSALGFLYHDAAGGNINMKVNAEWQITIKQ